MRDDQNIFSSKNIHNMWMKYGKDVSHIKIHIYLQLNNENLGKIHENFVL